MMVVMTPIEICFPWSLLITMTTLLKVVKMTPLSKQPYLVDTNEHSMNKRSIQSVYQDLRWKPMGLELHHTSTGTKLWPSRRYKGGQITHKRDNSKLPWIGWVRTGHFYMFSLFGVDLKLYFVDVDKNNKVQLRAGHPPSNGRGYYQDTRLFRVVWMRSAGHMGLRHVVTGKYMRLDTLEDISRTVLVRERMASSIMIEHLKFH